MSVFGRAVNRLLQVVTKPADALLNWLMPEPERWALVERQENKWLKTLSVHESREQAIAMWRSHTGGYAVITVMPYVEVQRWNNSLELYSQWEGENGIREQDQ